MDGAYVGLFILYINYVGRRKYEWASLNIVWSCR